MLMSGRDCNHVAQPEESVKSGAAFGLMLGGSKLGMDQSNLRLSAAASSLRSGAGRRGASGRVGSAQIGRG